MKIARDKGSSLVIAGTKSAQALNGDEVESDEVDGIQQFDNVEDDGDGAADGSNDMVEAKKGFTTAMPPSKPPAVNVEDKRRLSKAERKKLKKNPTYKPTPSSDVASNKAKAKRGSDFRDDRNFIENDVTHDTAAAARDRQMEAAMQPSASTSSKGSTALAYRIEENMLDIVGDENVDLVKRQRMMRWDKSKRKYIQTTVGDELSGDSKSKKIRLESGALVKNDRAKLGELYEKWQKKTNKSIGRVGVFDDVIEDAGTEDATSSKKGQKGAGKKAKETDERKTVVAIRKEREKKENMRIKNMKKDDRRQLESNKRADKEAPQSTGKRPGKQGPRGRWNGNNKKGGKNASKLPRKGY